MKLHQTESKLIPATSRIKLQRSHKRRLFENFLSLSVLQVVTYLLPLITVPYLVRVLGVEKFGLIAFSQAFIQYFIILTDFGFNLSATREISVHREDHHKIAEIFNCVMLIRFAFMVVCLAILTTIVLSFGKFRQEWILYFMMFGTVLGNILFPIWFFQGMEEMRYITVINVIAKSLFTLAIFVFVRESSDYLYVPLFNSLGFITAGIISLWIILRYFKVRIFFPNKSAIIQSIKMSAEFFLSRVSVSLYTSSNTFLLGLFTNNHIVGYYAAAEKIYMALQYLYQPLSNALYPYISKERNISLFKKIFVGATSFNLVLCLLIFMLAANICSILLGHNMQESANVLKIFSIVTAVVVPSILLGYPFLAALGHPGYANRSVIFGSIVHFTGLVFMSAFSAVDMHKVAAMVLITEVTVLASRLRGVIKEGLWRTK